MRRHGRDFRVRRAGCWETQCLSAASSCSACAVGRGREGDGWWSPCIPAPGRVRARRLQRPRALQNNVVSVPFSAFHCLSLPFTAFHWLSLAFTGFHCLSLPFTAFYCLSLPFTAFHVFIAFQEGVAAVRGEWWWRWRWECGSGSGSQSTMMAVSEVRPQCTHRRPNPPA